jgi:hypothetical protein
MNTHEVVLDPAPTGGKDHQEEHSSHGKNKVTVKIDTKKTLVQRGSYLVAEFKVMVGVDPSKELDQIVDGQLTPLDDSTRIVIKGGEEFISHVRAGGSS